MAQALVMAGPGSLGLLLVLGGAAPASAAGARCPAIAGGSAALQQVDPAARLRFIQENLRQAARVARAWTWFWGTAYATSAVVNLAISPAFDDPGRRIESYVSAASSLVGVTSLLVSPPQVLRDQRKLDALARRMSGGEDPCPVLAQAERILEQDARSDAFGKGALTRFGGVIYNLGVGLLLAYAFDRREAAALNTLIGIVVSQVMTTTRPEWTLRTLERYRGADLRPAPPPPLLPWALAPALGPGRLGLQVALSF